MSQPNSEAGRENEQQNPVAVEQPLLVQPVNQQEIRYKTFDKMTHSPAHTPPAVSKRRQQLNEAPNGNSAMNGQNHPAPDSPSDEQKNRNEQKANQNQDSPSSNEQDKSENVDENKSDNEEDDDEESNAKSDDKDEDEDRSGDDAKKEEPSGKKCFNKLCNSKKIYKKLRSKVEHAKYRFLCRPCYENYCNNDFCEFCEQIYSSTGNADDDDQWIGCDQCNRWNHIDCEKKYRNTNIHETKDQDTPYLCLTCTFKFKKDPPNEKKVKNPVNKEIYSAAVDDSKLLKQKLEISKEQRVQIFNRKNQSLPSLEYFLQNYNFRLWINENLIKDDLETLREAAKRNIDDGKKGVKKVKVD